MKASLTLSLLFWAFFLSACGAPEEYWKLQGRTMGTQWSVTLLPVEGLQSEGWLQAEIEANLYTINKSMSTYISDSEINRVSAAPVSVPIELSSEMSAVLEEALRISALTDGAYDVTVGPLVTLWGFGPEFKGDALPSEGERLAALSKVGYEALVLDHASDTLIKREPRELDFSSIAKGYGVDEIARLLSDRGVQHFLVEIGGELRASGVNPQGLEWKIAVRNPNVNNPQAADTLPLRDLSVATSGDYFNFFTVGGMNYSHVIDPKTGWPIQHDIVSVTVLHESAMTADAWATAMLVLGRDRALELAQAEGLAVLLLANTDAGLEAFASERFLSHDEDLK